MTKRAGTKTWKVEGVLPTDLNGRPYNKNVNFQVVADSLEEAVALTREKYPEITLHKVMTDRWIDDVIIGFGGKANA